MGINVKKSVGTALILLSAAAMTACGRQNNNDIIEENTDMSTEYTWEEKDYSGLVYNSSYLTYPDEFRIHAVTDKLELAKVGNRQYGFEPGISQEDREACIEATEVMLGRIGFDGELNIYIYTEDKLKNSYYIDEKDGGENSLYAYISDWKSPDYVTGLLLSVYGRYSNYGIAHGYAGYLCRSVWKNTSDSASPVFDAEYNCYDLNLLCFNEDFVTGGGKREAEGASDAFVQYYIDKNGEAELRGLLGKSGHPDTCGEFNEELEKWYSDNGLTLTNPLSKVLYTYGGCSYQYIAYNGYAVFYMDRDWQDINYERNPLVTENFLHEDYAETRKFYEINTEQMRQYRELFGLENDGMDVPVVMSNRNITTITHTSSYGYGRIYILTVSSLPHEYIHTICIPTSLTFPWAIEGWATAFCLRYNYYAYDFLSEDYNNAALDEENFFLAEFIEMNGHPINMETDYMDVYNLYVYAGNNYDPNYSLASGASFINYLCDTYGERKVIDYVCDNHDLTTLTEKTFDELVEDWKNNMEVKYSEYSKGDLGDCE